MKKLIIASVLFCLNAAGAPVCSKYCNPDRSKPCGNACIPKENSCRKAWTTACVGDKPKASKVSYTPKHVDKAP